MATCCKCAAPADEVWAATPTGDVVMLGHMCDPCFAKASAGADLLREEFEGMLAAGISREAANAHLIAKIDGNRGTA